MGEPKEPKLYSVEVDGKIVKSSSPITEAQVLKKMGLMEKSGAFTAEEDCKDCPKTEEDGLVKL